MTASTGTARDLTAGRFEAATVLGRVAAAITGASGVAGSAVSVTSGAAGGARALGYLLRKGGAVAVEAAAVTAALAGLAGVSWAGLMHQARTTESLIEAAARAACAGSGMLPEGVDFAWQAVPRSGDGTYLPDGTGPLERVPADRRTVLTMLGDSTAVGYGCASADEVPGVVLARGVAAALGRPVRITTHGKVGTGAADLARQITEALPDRPDVVVVVVGSNDVRDRIPPHHAASQLGQAVAALRAQRIPVVVGTCPDLGVIASIPQPLRGVVGLWSRALAARQARAVTAAGGVAVPIARLVSPDFNGRPELFYADGFHPSGPGYAKAAAALLPEVLAAVQGP